MFTIGKNVASQHERVKFYFNSSTSNELQKSFCLNHHPVFMR